jgi:hypothetical protein
MVNGLNGYAPRNPGYADQFGARYFFHLVKKFAWL